MAGLASSPPAGWNVGGSGLQGGPVLDEVRERCRSAKLSETHTLDAQNVALAALRATGRRQKALDAAQATINRLVKESAHERVVG